MGKYVHIYYKKHLLARFRAVSVYQNQGDFVFQTSDSEIVIGRKFVDFLTIYDGADGRTITYNYFDLLNKTTVF